MKTVLIVFPDDWLSYSPTILNLVTLMLKRGFGVRVLTVRSSYPIFGVEAGVSYIDIDRRIKRALGWFRLYDLYRTLRIAARLRREPRHDYYIAVDSLGALCVQLAGLQCYDFLSLEARRDTALWLLDRRFIRCVLIQSPERYGFLFGGESLSRHIIQNAPILNSPAVAQRPPIGPIRLVYFGNAIRPHGIIECIDLVAQDPDVTLEICGVIADDVKDHATRPPACDRIRIRRDYIDQAGVREYLSGFDVGLCLYNVADTDFNYQTIPSGKLFNYYSAGLPVIGSNLVGLRSVVEFGAGVLVDSNTVPALRSALARIRVNYVKYSEGSVAASSYFEFGRMSKPYLEFLEQK